MSVKITIILTLTLGLSHLANGSFFGLFGSSKPTRKPNVIVKEYPTAKSDRNAYENYLRSLANIYYSSGKIEPPVQYLAYYAYGPQMYANNIIPQQNLVYHNSIKPNLIKTITVPLQPSYFSVQKHSDVSNSKLESPIVVLPSSSFSKPSYHTNFRNGKNFNKLIEESYSNAMETQAFKFPEHQISTTLYDLPVSESSPDYSTIGYVTKMITTNSPQI